MDELYKWYLGEYPMAFLAYIQVGTHYRHLIKVHAEADAAHAANKKKP